MAARMHERSFSRLSSVLRIAVEPKKDLVEKRDLGFGKHAGCLRLDHPIPQPPQVDGTDDLARLGEPTKQVLEVAAAERSCDAANRLALRRARWAQDEQVLARHGRERHEVHQDLSLHQPSRRARPGRPSMHSPETASPRHYTGHERRGPDVPRSAASLCVRGRGVSRCARAASPRLKRRRRRRRAGRRARLVGGRACAGWPGDGAGDRDCRRRRDSVARARQSGPRA
jgi:hypothetical protein